MERPPKALWLDGALGAAGAATALAVLISPEFTTGGGDLGAVLVGAAFPVADLLLIAMIFGVLAVRGFRGGSMWLWLGVGLLTFCAADVAYALRVATSDFVVGTLWSSLWGAGITIAASRSGGPSGPGPASPGRSTAMLAIPMLAVAIAVRGSSSPPSPRSRPRSSRWPP